MTFEEPTSAHPSSGRRCKVFSHHVHYCDTNTTPSLPRRRSELKSSSVLPPSAVVLLNSPSVGPWELQEWRRLFGIIREAQPNFSDTLPCYFVCADGAYSTMKRWSAELGLTSIGEPDVVIGDMDSLASVSDDSMTPFGEDRKQECFPTVSDIPRRLLEVIRSRAMGEVTLPTLFIHIQCQMTTDFQKAALLVELLEETFPADFPRLTYPVDEEAIGVMSLYQEFYRRACSAQAEATPHDKEENHRVFSLLHEVMDDGDDESRKTTFLLLPQVIVFGALGGRFDHEMACANCVLQHSQRYHMTLTNEYNLITACLPDGITQWLLSPPSNAPSTLKCGVIPMGAVHEMETTGLQYNIVKGRPHRYDGATQTESYRFSMDGLLSACNTALSPIVTIDLRPLHSTTRPASGLNDHLVNPPTLLSTSQLQDWVITS